MTESTRFKMTMNINKNKKSHAQGILDHFFVIVPKKSKGELLIHYKLSFQHNELALVDINRVGVLQVKRVIELPRPLNTNNQNWLLREL